MDTPITLEKVQELAGQGINVNGYLGQDGLFHVSKADSNLVKDTETFQDPKTGAWITRTTAKGGKGTASDPEAQAKARSSVSSIVGQISTNFANLNKMGAGVDPSNSSLDNFSNYLASTGMGQEYGRMTASEAQAYKDAIVQLQPTLMNFVRKASEMGAKGMDSEKELSFFLSALGDPKRNIFANLKALEEVDKAYGEGNAVATMLKDRPELLAKVRATELKYVPTKEDKASNGNADFESELKSWEKKYPNPPTR